MEYIYEIYREKSFSKAAQKLFISQPSLSATVKRVERELELPLFNRSTNPVSLTEAGKRYIEAAEKIMAVENELREQLAELSERSSGRLNIGSSMFFCSYVLPNIVEEFRGCHPDITVTLSEGGSSVIADRLRNGEADFMLETEALDKNVFESVVWKREKLVMIVPASCKINESLKKYRYTFEELKAETDSKPVKPAVSAAAFANEQFLFLKNGHDSYKRGMSICREAGFKPSVSMYLEQMMTAYYLVCEGKGVAFVRDTILSCLAPTDKIYFYRIDSEKSERSIYLSYKKSGALTQVQRDFIEFMTAKT